MSKVIGLHPCEQNGQLDRGMYKISTRKELAEFLNGLAQKNGIIRTESNPEGYWATEENIG